MMNIDKNKVLSNDNLLGLRGGVREACFHCTCIDSVGEWYGYYDSLPEMEQSIIQYCESEQGSCVADTECDVI